MPLTGHEQTFVSTAAPSRRRQRRRQQQPPGSPAAQQRRRLRYQALAAFVEMQRFANKVAIVTASTEGIGLAIAQRFCREGARVVISSRKEKNVQNVLEKLQSEYSANQCHGLVCHVGKAEDRRSLIEETKKKFGNIDILVSNAGVSPYVGRLIDITEDTWDKMFDVNVKSAMFLVKEAVPHMNRGSSIVFVSSIGGYVTLPLIAAYSVTKTALLGLSKALAHDLASDRIRVNAIAPGFVKTRFSSSFWQNDALSSSILSQTPMGRFADPEECAGSVSFLCSDDASYITGEVVGISGGMHSRL